MIIFLTPWIGKFSNVAEISFNFLGLLTFILYLQIEQYYFLCYNNIIFSTKTLKLAKVNQIQDNLGSSKINSIFFFFLILSIFFSKLNTLPISALITFSIFFFFLINNFFNKLIDKTFSNKFIYLILPTFSIFSFFFFLINSFLSLFFFIELYSVLYYFCFLSTYNLTNQTILKYKNGLLLLLWNNFMTSFFLALGCFLMAKIFGTTNFIELSILTNEFIFIYFYLLGLFWKLGLPIFHFFKLEVYKYLLKENVFLFSIITTLINTIIIIFCISQPVIFNTIYLHNLFLIIIIFTIFLAIVNLNLTNILHFFALSGIFTLSTFISLFLI